MNSPESIISKYAPDYGYQWCSKRLNLSVWEVKKIGKLLKVKIDKSAVSSNMLRPNSFTNEQKAAILKGDKSAEALAKEFGKSVGGVKNIAKKHKAILPPKERSNGWSEEEDSILIENFYGKSENELIPLLNGRSARGIRYRAYSVLNLTKDPSVTSKRVSDSRRIYSFDKNFFKEIDNHEKAYWLGFLWADGSLSRKKQLSLSLHKKDSNHIEKFKSAIKSEHPIKDIKGQEMSKIVISSYEMSEHLIEKGLIPNKTMDYIEPKFPEEFRWSFLLGLFDGDGCITSPLAFRICLRPELGLWIMKWIAPYVEKPHLYDVKNKQVKILSVSNKKDALFLYKEMYECNTSFLGRKKIKFEELLRRKKLL